MPSVVEGVLEEASCGPCLLHIVAAVDAGHSSRRVLSSMRPSLRRPSAARGFAYKAAQSLTRPRMEEFVLVRHGESEGNIAFNRSVAGDHSLYSGAFLERHSSFWRLSDRGREQAAATGEWMRTHMDVNFDAHFSSE